MVVLAEEASSSFAACAGDLNTLMADVTTACCAAGSDCNGIPDACSAGCANVFTTFWDRCAVEMADDIMLGSFCE